MLLINAHYTHVCKKKASSARQEMCKPTTLDSLKGVTLVHTHMNNGLYFLLEVSFSL